MAPYSGSEFDLMKGEWIRLTDPVRKKQITPAYSEPSAKKKDSPYRDLMKAVQDLKEYADGMEQSSYADIRKLTEEIRKLII